MIKFCAKFGFTTAKMFKMMKAIYGESAVLCATVKRWHCQFSEGRESFKYKAGFTLATKTLANKCQLRGNKSEFIQTAPFSLAAEVNILSLIFS